MHSSNSWLPCPGGGRPDAVPEQDEEQLDMEENDSVPLLLPNDNASHAYVVDEEQEVTTNHTAPPSWTIRTTNGDILQVPSHGNGIEALFVDSLVERDNEKKDEVQPIASSRPPLIPQQQQRRRRSYSNASSWSTPRTTSGGSSNSDRPPVLRRPSVGSSSASSVRSLHPVSSPPPTKSHEPQSQPSPPPQQQQQQRWEELMETVLNMHTLKRSIPEEIRLQRRAMRSYTKNRSQPSMTTLPQQPQKSGMVQITSRGTERVIETGMEDDQDTHHSDSSRFPVSLHDSSDSDTPHNPETTSDFSSNMGIGGGVAPTHLHELCAKSAVTLEELWDCYNQYPDAIRVQDFRGRYPLHILADNETLLASFSQTATVFANHLINEFPLAIITPDQEGYIPFCNILADGTRSAKTPGGLYGSIGFCTGQ